MAVTAFEAVGSSSRSGVLPPLEEGSTVKTVNLFDRQWSWLDDTAQDTGLNRSQLLRTALDRLICDVSVHGVDATIRDHETS